MSHGRKGDRAESLAWHEKAVSWLDRDRPDEDELPRSRAEAETLIQRGGATTR